MTTKTYYIGTGMLKEEPATKRVFIIAPGCVVEKDNRSVDEIIQSAVEKGFNVSYCALYVMGISGLYADRAKEAILKLMKKEFLIKSDWDVEIDVVNKISVYSET